MAMNPKLLRPKASGVHPEAAAWRTAVIANGGTVSATTMGGVNRFCLSIESAGLRDRFLRLNLVCGNSLLAALVPLYLGQSRTATQLGNTTDTNNNFVSGDYTEATGLQGNGSTKYLITGVNASNLNRNSTHLGVYGTNLGDASTGYGSLAGARDGTANNLIQLDGKNSNVAVNRFFSSAANSVVVAGSPAATGGHVIGVSASSTDLRVYVAGSSTGITATDRTSGLLIAQPIYIFANNFNGSPSDHSAMRCRAYSFGIGMTAAQVLAFYNALQTFQTSLGRNA